MTARFACASGLASALGPQVLGSYDGSGAWRIYLAELTSAAETMLVEMHEGLHHELQSSTSWGLMSAMSGELAARGYREDALREAFAHTVEASRTTHELFATAISGFVVGESSTDELLRDNDLYRGFFSSAVALVDREDAPGPGFHQAAVAAVLRACMSPASALDLIAGGFDRLEASAIAGLEGPDVRLAAYQASGAAGSWREVFDGVLSEHPHGLRSRWGEPVPTLPDEDSEEFVRQRRFEEEVLLPACYRHAEQVLAGAGLPSVPFDEQSSVALALKAAVEAVDPELASRLELVVDRRPIADDGLQYDRQQVVLRERLEACIEPLPSQLTGKEFAWTDEFGETAFAVWISASVARKQWRFGSDEPVSDVVRALVIGADQGDGVRFGSTNVDSPSRLQDVVGAGLPLVVVTTHLSLADERIDAELRTVEPVFVLMDLPVAWHVDHWLGQGVQVRMAASPLEGSPNDLWLLGFAVDRRPGMVFLSIGGAAGVAMLLERLRRKHSEAISIDPAVLTAHRVGIDLALRRVFATWHVLDQDGVEARSS